MIEKFHFIYSDETISQKAGSERYISYMYGCWLLDAVPRVALLLGELLGPSAEVAGRCCLLCDTFWANHLGHAGYGNANGRFMTRWSPRLGSC